MQKYYIHAWLMSAACESNYDKFYTCRTSLSLLIKKIYARFFYDYIEVLDENQYKKALDRLIKIEPWNHEWRNRKKKLE